MAEAEDVHDAVRAHLIDGLRLLDEALRPIRVGDHLGGQDFQSYRPVERDVLGPVDHAHSSRPRSNYEEVSIPADAFQRLAEAAEAEAEAASLGTRAFSGPAGIRLGPAEPGRDDPRRAAPQTLGVPRDRLLRPGGADCLPGARGIPRLEALARFLQRAVGLVEGDEVIPRGVSSQLHPSRCGHGRA